MFTTLQATILAVSVPLYAMALCGLLLRWLRTRDETCGRCAHRIATGQSDRCAECGATLTTPRSRRYEPRWIRRVQLFIGLLSIAGIAWTALTVVGRPRLLIEHEWAAWVQWADDAETKVTAILRELKDSNSSQAVMLDGVFCRLEHRDAPRMWFRLVKADATFRVQLLDHDEAPTTSWLEAADEKALAALFVERNVLPEISLATFVATVAFERLRNPMVARKVAIHSDAELPDVNDGPIGVAGFGHSAGSFPKPYQASRAAWTLSVVIAAVLLALLVPAAFWRIDRVGARSRADRAPSEEQLAEA